MPLDEPLEIKQITALVAADDQSCMIADGEINFYSKEDDSEESQLRTIKNALKYERLQNEKQNREDRKKYANRIFWLMVSWISAIILIIIVNGFGDYLNFIVSDKVLIALISGTTINVLGIFIIVAKYLFNHGNGGTDKMNKKNDQDKTGKKPKKAKP